MIEPPLTLSRRGYSPIAMMVFWKERLSILEVPKTGSTALAEVLGPHAAIHYRHPPELRHSPVYRYNRWMRPLFSKACKTELETFAMIREPMSWLQSWYRYRQRADQRRGPDSTADISFNAFLEAYLTPKEERPAFANVGAQGRFLESPDGDIGVDHLFRYEEQPRAIAFLEDRLGRKLDLNRVNISPDITIEVDPALAAQHRRDFAKCYAFWEAAGQQA